MSAFVVLSPFVSMSCFVPSKAIWEHKLKKSNSFNPPQINFSFSKKTFDEVFNTSYNIV